MTTIQLNAFLEAYVFTDKFPRPRANFDSRILSAAQDQQRPKGSHQGGDESHSSVLVQERHSFVLQPKKSTELNGGHLELTL